MMGSDAPRTMLPCFLKSLDCLQWRFELQRAFSSQRLNLLAPTSALDLLVPKSAEGLLCIVLFLYTSLRRGVLTAFDWVGEDVEGLFDAIQISELKSAVLITYFQVPPDKVRLRKGILICFSVDSFLSSTIVRSLKDLEGPAAY